MSRSRPLIVVTNRIHEQVCERLAAHGELCINGELEPWPEATLARHLAGATAMMGFMTDSVDAARLAAAPRLRVIACALKGYDGYDAAACAAAGVWLSIVPDLLTEPTAELALGLAIALGRQMRAGDQHVRAGGYRGWRAQFYGRSLHQAVVAVVGLGQVGQAILRRLGGFGCARLIGVDPAAQAVPAGVERRSLDAALAEAEVVFLAAPLDAGSLHLFDAARLARCRPELLLINVGRGSVVDEAAVAAALENGDLGGYAADVFACEDRGLASAPAGIPPCLLAAPRTLFTPHLGSAVGATRLAIEQRAADNIIAVLTGRIPPDAIAGPGLAHARACAPA